MQNRLNIIAGLKTAGLVSAFALATSGAWAGEYDRSISGCEDAIAKQLGIEALDARYNLEKVKSKARSRNLDFKVSVLDDKSPVQGVDVRCQVRRGGEVLALEFQDGSFPNAVATQ